jgi:transposase, IS30 family
MNYHHLTQVERYQIQSAIELGLSIKAIAIQINRHRSTVFRELKRNGHISREGYFAQPAGMDYKRRREKCGPKLKIKGNLKSYINSKIKLRWSPEQIEGRRKLEKRDPISAESIYRYLYRNRLAGGDLWRYLRHSRPRRKKRFPLHRWPKSLQRLSAEERPQAIENRTRQGDFERDLIVGTGRTGYLLTMVDRSTKLVLLRKIAHPKANLVHDVTVRAFKKYPIRSLTNDNGFEFTAHHKTSRRLNIPIYFCRPYASWERGTVENTNKLIRQFFPKQKNLMDITHAQVKMVQTLLNNRPRKLLGFKTPAEIHVKKSARNDALDKTAYQKFVKWHCPTIKMW